MAPDERARRAGGRFRAELLMGEVCRPARAPLVRSLHFGGAAVNNLGRSPESKRRRRGPQPFMAVRLSRTFVLRKLHQLSGIVPLGAFLLEHLYTNSKGLHPTDGPEHFNEAVADLQQIPYILFVEITFIFIPLLYHAVYGLP